MGRAAGAKNKPKLGEGTRFRTWEGIYPKDKHIRLTDYMMNTPVYRGLSSSAKVLYAYMKLWACGRDTVVYAASMSKDIMDKKTYQRARNELVDKGFIEYINRHRARDMRESAEYLFSSEWLKRANTYL